MRFLRASTKRSSTQQKGGGARPSRILSMELLRCLSNLRRREREREQRKTTQLTGLKLCNYGWPPQLGCIWLYSCKKAHASIWYTSWTLPTKTIPQHTFELNYWNRNPRVRSLSKFNIPRPIGVLQALCHYAPKQANFWVPAVGFWTVIAWWWHVFFPVVSLCYTLGTLVPASSSGLTLSLPWSCTCHDVFDTTWRFRCPT